MQNCERYLDVKNRVNVALKKSSFNQNVSILAATKNRPIEQIFELVECGVKIIGENKIQEASSKGLEKLPSFVEKHFIGNLQTNKVKKAVSLFDCIQSVDSMKLVNKISNSVENNYPIFLQINIGSEIQKSGVNVNSVFEICNEINAIENINLNGIMIIPPNDSIEKTVLHFQKTRKIFDELKLKISSIKVLSMGMSNDFEEAVKCGSTMIRIGRTLFN